MGLVGCVMLLSSSVSRAPAWQTTKLELCNQYELEPQLAYKQRVASCGSTCLLRCLCLEVTSTSHIVILLLCCCAVPVAFAVRLWSC